MDSICEYTLVCFGYPGVGKSSSVIRFTNDIFVESYDPTIEDIYQKQCSIEGREYLLKVLDTAANDEVSAMRNHFIYSCNGFILEYSITSKRSFDALGHFIQNIQTIKDMDKFPMVILGNKCDLEFERQVFKEEGEELAKELSCPFYETSALDNSNIIDAFQHLVLEVQRFNTFTVKNTSK